MGSFSPMIMPTDFTPFSISHGTTSPTNLLNDIVAAEVIDNAHYQFLRFFVHTHQQGIVNHVDD